MELQAGRYHRGLCLKISRVGVPSAGFGAEAGASLAERVSIYLAGSLRGICLYSYKFHSYFITRRSELQLLNSGCEKSDGNLTPVIPYPARRNQIGC